MGPIYDGRRRLNVGIMAYGRKKKPLYACISLFFVRFAVRNQNVTEITPNSLTMKIKHLLSLLLASATMPYAAQADEIQLTLASDVVGTTKELALNADLSATLHWGDGTTQTVVATGLPQSIAVKHATLSIKTTGTNDLTQVFAPGWGVTRVTFTATKGLEVLDLSDSQLLTTPTFTTAYLPALRELYVRNAGLKGTLMLNTLATLEVVDASNNALTAFIAPATTTSKIRSVVLSGNQLKSVSLGSAQGLTTAWLNDNQLKSVSTSTLPRLTTLVASGNQLTAVTLGAASPIQNLWVDENELTTLDLSTTTAIQTISAEDNKLTEIKYPSIAQRAKIKEFYVRGNALPATAIVDYALASGALRSTITALVGEQSPVALGVTQVDPNVALDVKAFFTNVNNYNITPKFTVMHSSGTAVDPTKYTINTSAKTITFKEALGAVYLSVTATRTPGATFKSSWVDVGAVTAIHSASKDQASLDVAAVEGGIVLSVASPVAVKVHSVSGATVYDAVVRGTTTVSLPAGVYVVNGKKVLVP